MNIKWAWVWPWFCCSSCRCDWSVHTYSSKLQLRAAMSEGPPERSSCLWCLGPWAGQEEFLEGGVCCVSLWMWSLLHALDCCFHEHLTVLFSSLFLNDMYFLQSQFVLHKTLMASGLETWHEFSGKWFWTCFNPSSGKLLLVPSLPAATCFY